MYFVLSLFQGGISANIEMQIALRAVDCMYLNHKLCQPFKIPREETKSMNLSANDSHDKGVRQDGGLRATLAVDSVICLCT
jgi:hypothetical protein